MAAYTSTGTGSWSDPATWGDSGPPTAGDTVTIAAGHTVTVPAGTTSVGTGSGVAVQLGSGANLTIATGATLSVSGQVKLGTGYNEVDITLLGQAGSILEFDASSGQDCGILIDTGSGGPGKGLLSFAGVGGSHVIVRRKGSPTGNVPILQAVNARPFTLSWAYTDFSGFGTASAFGLAFNAAGGSYVITHCTFDACSARIQAGADSTFTDNTFTSSVLATTADADSTALALWLGGTTTEGTLPSHALAGCSFDGLVTITYADFGTNASPNYFGGGLWHWTRGLLDATGSFFDVTAVKVGPSGTLSDCYVLHSTTGDNPHFASLANTAATAVTGCVFEAPQATIPTDGGDVVLIGDTIQAVTDNLVLPIADGVKAGVCPGVLASMQGGASTSITIEHNTCVGSHPECRYGETYAGHAGMIASFKSNLFANLSGTPAGYKLIRQGDTTPDDGVLAANATNNAGFGLEAGISLKGYNYGSTGIPGASDVDGEDPGFVDSTRNLVTWAITQDASIATLETYTAKIAAAKALLAADVSLIPTARDWVRAGFAPTNVALQAAHDSEVSGWIGAVAGTTAGLTFTWAGSATSGEVGSKPSDAAGTMLSVLSALAILLDAPVLSPTEFTLTSSGAGDKFYTLAGELVADGKFTVSEGALLTVMFGPALIGAKTLTAAATGYTGPTHTFTGLMQTGMTRPLEYDAPGNPINYDARDCTTPDLGGYVPCLAGPLSEYTRAIDADTVHPHDDLMMACYRDTGPWAAEGVRTMTGTGWTGGGMPLAVVPGDQAKVPVSLTGDESDPSYCDPGPYPIPDTAGVQGTVGLPPTASNGTDSHCLVFDRDNELEYEGYHCYKDAETGWVWGNGSIWDMAHGGGGYTADPEDPRYCAPGTHRHINFPTITAAGIPILPLAVRYDEVGLRQEIKHAVGVSIRNIKLAGQFIWPARAQANWGAISEAFDGVSYGWPIPYGGRLRLKQSWYDANVTGAEEGTWGPQSLVLLEAFRKYGVVLTDGGANFDVWFVPDWRWDFPGDLTAISNVPIGAFEVVDWTNDASVTVDPTSLALGDSCTATIAYNFRAGENPNPITVDPQFQDGASNRRLCSPWQVSLTPDAPSQTATYTPEVAGTETFYWNKALSWDYFAGLLEITTADPPAPLAAGTLTAGTPTDTTVDLTCTAATGGTPPYSYQLQRDTEPGWDMWLDLMDPTAAPEWSVTGLTAETYYSFRVVVTDAVDATATSNTVEVTTAAAPVEPATIAGYPINGCPFIRGSLVQ